MLGNGRGYKVIDFSAFTEKMAAAGIGENWPIRIIFHTHPFDRCWSWCGPNRGHFGPSSNDQTTALKIQGYDVVREIKGNRYSGGYQDLYYGPGSF